MKKLLIIALLVFGMNAEAQNTPDVIKYRGQDVTETIKYETVQSYLWIEKMNDFSIVAKDNSRITISIDTKKEQVIVKYVGGETYMCYITDFEEKVTTLKDGTDLFVNSYTMVTSENKHFLIEVDQYTKNVALYTKYRNHSGYKGFNSVDALVVEFQ